MLDTLRKQKDNYIYTGLILVVAVVMGFFGVSKFDSDDKGSGGAAAWVNGELITRREFFQELQAKLQQYQSLLGANYDEKFLSALQVPQRTLEELIQYKLLAQQAKRLGILVPDQELADHIRSLPYYQKNGQFDAELYSKIPNRGVEEKSRRERLQLAKFQSYLVDRIRLTPAEARRAFDLKETKVDLEYAKIDFNQLAQQNPPSAAQVEAFLKKTPEAELLKAYEEHKRDYTDKGRVDLLQIRVAVPFQASDAVKAEAKKKIEAIRKEVTPANFAEIAKKFSDDEYAKKGGARGWVTRGTLEPQVETALDKLEKGQVSAPVESSLGYYVFLEKDKKPEVAKPFAEVKAKVAQKLLIERTKKEFADTRRAEWDKLLAAGKPIDAELKKMKVEIKKTGSFSIGQGSIPQIGPVDSIVDAVFQMTPEKPMGKQLFPYQDAYYYVKLKTVDRAKGTEFAKLSEQVERAEESALQTEFIQRWVAGLQKQSTIKTDLRLQNAQL